MAFQMEAWLHGRMLRCVLCLHHRGGWRLPSEHRDCCIQKAYHLCIFFGCSQGRNAVAIFGKRESPQLRIYCLQLQELSMSAVASTYTPHRNNIISCTSAPTPRKGTLFPVCGLRLKHDPQKRENHNLVLPSLIPTLRKSVIFDMIKRKEEAKMVGGKNLTFSCYFGAQA